MPSQHPNTRCQAKVLLLLEVLRLHRREWRVVAHEALLTATAPRLQVASHGANTLTIYDNDTATILRTALLLKASLRILQKASEVGMRCLDVFILTRALQAVLGMKLVFPQDHNN
jgi:hypothetical protein